APGARGQPPGATDSACPAPDLLDACRSGNTAPRALPFTVQASPMHKNPAPSEPKLFTPCYRPRPGNPPQRDSPPRVPLGRPWPAQRDTGKRQPISGTTTRDASDSRDESCVAEEDG